MAARRARQLVLGLLVAALVVTACSSDEPEAIEMSAESTTPTSADSPPPSADTTSSSSTGTGPGVSGEGDWIEQASAACQGVVDELAALDTEDPTFLDERARIRDQLIEFIESHPAPPALATKAEEFVEVLAALSTYDRSMAASGRGEAVAVVPPTSTDTPDLGLDCGDEF